jgi:hypothetical protein
MSQALLLLHQPRAEATEERRRSEHLRALESPQSRKAAGRNDAEITVRALHEGDRPAVEGLAGRDSAQLPTGYALGAEIDGELVATLSLTDGSVIADPFRPTSSAIELLRLRASQLGASSGRRRLPRLRRRGATPRARGALAGSPPGGGSHLLQL